MAGQWKILVIDDEERICQLLKEALEPPYEVHVARDGREGLVQARTVKPDLILLDLRMPRTDGLTVLAKLKAHRKMSTIPVIIISAKGETDSLLEGQRAGAADYLIKPLVLEELYQVIRRQLALRGA